MIESDDIQPPPHLQEMVARTEALGFHDAGTVVFQTIPAELACEFRTDLLDSSRNTSMESPDALVTRRQCLPTALQSAHRQSFHVGSANCAIELIDRRVNLIAQFIPESGSELRGIAAALKSGLDPSHSSLSLR